ncbi:hypothetical protein FRC01_007545 [Tulasnella sp. 417]|nr:hypothetical protein FRC01_007545 [Tulasnella sp. 417]
MAPTSESIVKRGNYGIKLTKYEYKHGKYVKYWWSYKHNSPEKFLIIFVEVKHHYKYVAKKEWTKKYGNYKGHGKTDLHAIRGKPGKYVIRIVKYDDHDYVYDESKPFWVKEKDYDYKDDYDDKYDNEYDDY